MNQNHFDFHMSCLPSYVCQIPTIVGKAVSTLHVDIVFSDILIRLQTNETGCTELDVLVINAVSLLRLLSYNNDTQPTFLQTMNII